MACIHLQTLQQLVLSHKKVFYGTPNLILDAHGVENVDETRTLLSRYRSLTVLRSAPKQRELHQILWQKCRAQQQQQQQQHEDADGKNQPEQLRLLKSTAIASVALQKDVRSLLFDIICHPIDECIAEIVAHVKEVRVLPIVRFNRKTKTTADL